MLTKLEQEHFRVRVSCMGDCMGTAKEEVESLLSRLPDDCSLEDIQYHLYVMEKVNQGLGVAESKGAVSQEEAERRLNKWLTK